MTVAAGARPIRIAELIAVGSELTNGDTKDSNASDLARSLASVGVTVQRITFLPDDQGAVSGAIAAALGAADVVVLTGGIGPTPDDLTRESIAAVVGETPAVDPDLERWLRNLFDRRGIPFAEANRKQAWLIPSATSIPNPRGTAPGWWVDGPDGRVVVALPGPPREMKPMWEEWVVPRLRERGLGDGRIVRTLRLTGIGESQVVARLGADLLTRPNPIIATYARAEAVDVRISAVPGPIAGDSQAATAAAILAEAEATVRAELGEHIWAEGETTWAEMLDRRLGERGWTLATVEAGTDGSLVALLAGMPTLRHAAVRGGTPESSPLNVAAAAEEARSAAGVAVGLALVALPHRADMLAHLAVATDDGTRSDRRRVFLAGPLGQLRAAVSAAAFLSAVLEEGIGGPRTG